MSLAAGVSVGLAARAASAVAVSTALAWWHSRCARRPARISAALSRWLALAALLLGGFWSVVWLLIAAARLRYPYELEWMGGAMRDHCERVLAGQPLYVRPGGDWFPFLYPPLYYWVCALVMHATGGVSFTAMRAISIASTLGVCALLFVWVRRLASLPVEHPAEPVEHPAEPVEEGRSRPRRYTTLWAALAVSVVLASYRLTGAWYDLERVDMLAVFLSALGVCWLEWPGCYAQRGIGRFAAPMLAAALLAAAFLTKQQSIVFAAGGILALGIRRAWQQMAVFAAGCTTFIGAAVALLHRASGGWFEYYAFGLPTAAGMQAGLVGHFLLIDVPLFAPMVALMLLGLQSSPDRECVARRDAGLWATTSMALVSSLASRAHWGGYDNVLIPTYVCLAAAGCAYAARAAARSPRTNGALFALVLAQLLLLTYRPLLQIPSVQNRRAGEWFSALIRRLEPTGEVLCADHGGLTAAPHFHTMALSDVTSRERRLPEGLAQALRARRYAAIVSDARPDRGAFWSEALSTYPLSGHYDVGGHWVMTGFLTPGPEGRVWILRARPRASSASYR